MGNNGSGTFIQSGGTNSVSNLYLGFNTGSSGSYTLGSSGLLFVTGGEFVGNLGPGSFTQSGGVNYVAGSYLSLGNSAGISGSYSLNGSGGITAGGEYVGNGGNGTFTQSGGTNSVGVTGLYLGNNAASGNYNLSGSGVLLASGTEYVGSFGAGTFNQLGGTNTVPSLSLGLSGAYNLGGGALLVNGIQANGGVFNFSGGTLVASSVFSTSQAMTLTSSGGNFNTNGNAVALAGVLSGSGGLIKSGGGILTLASSNTYTGSTILAGGGLMLDFTQPTSPTTNIINNTALVLNGGTLAILGAGTPNSQQFNGLTVNPGSSFIVLTATGTSNPLSLGLGGINRSAGGMIDFTLSGTQSATSTITTTAQNGSAGILGAYATVNGGTGWANSTGTNGNAGNIMAYSGYTTGSLALVGTNSGFNVLLSGTQSAVNSALTINTLNLSGSLGVSMTGTAASLTLAGGGLIGNTTGTISGGTLQGPSGVGGELIVITPKSLAIGSVITNNSGNTTALTKAGTGTLTLTGGNIYSGGTTIDAGVSRSTAAGPWARGL